MKRDYNRIYAYTTESMKKQKWVGNREGIGLIKVGQTCRDVEKRVKVQFQGSPDVLTNSSFEILLDEEALSISKNYFKDADVFKWLKIMGVYRIPKTEWFEATLEEIKKAVNNCVLEVPLRTFSYKKKNTVENRGSFYDKEEAKREKSFIKSPDRIINVMKLYKDANSLVKIGERMHEHYKIKQYAPSTIVNIIAPTVKELVNLGIIENKGTFYAPNLILISTNSKVRISIKEKPKVTLKILKGLAKAKKEGITVQEIEKVYSIPNKSYLYEILDREFIKVPYRNKEEFNGKRYKYILPGFAKYLNTSENSFESNISKSYTEEDIFIVKRKGLKYIKDRRALASIIKKTELPSDKIITIIEKEFPKYVVAHDNKNDLCVYRKSCYTGARELQRKSKLEKDEQDFKKIEELLKKKRVLRVLEIADLLKWSKNKVYPLIKGRKIIHIGDYLTLPEFLDQDFNSLSFSARIQSIEYNIDRDVILDIIKRNPHCNSNYICSELKALCNIEVSQGYFSHLVSSYKRILLEENLIVCTSKNGNLHIKDSEHNISLSSYDINVSDLIEFLKTKKIGATTKEIFTFFEGNISTSKLYFMLKKLPEVNGVQVLSEKSIGYYWRWFFKGNKVELPPDEELYSALCV